ncbi:MAG: hypothetical protein LW809_06145 [Vampirovibrionales bacterium]|jgi:hypothetical protein|nr:hypothetical protein [Vampirovibrionales bacterium]
MADYGNYSQPPLSARRYETQLQNPATVAVGGGFKHCSRLYRNERGSRAIS